MTIKVIKNDDDYEAALHEYERLMALAPEKDSEEFNQFEVLDLLIGRYEEREHPVELPDPIEAIEAVMEADGLSRRDLVPYIGSASKVSEVLSRKRPLTLPMIRALRDGLGLPAEVLIAETTRSDKEELITPEKFPHGEIRTLGWFPKEYADKSTWMKRGPEIISSFLKPITDGGASPMLRREGFRQRGTKKMDPIALTVWQAEAIRRADSQRLPNFKDENLNEQFLSYLAKLSGDNDGPTKAISELKNIGISVIILPHLRKTYLDGAAFRLQDGRPAIGLTLRHDRVDNFWFVLMHELIHVWKHLTEEQAFIVDDLDSTTTEGDEFKDIEDEADKLALNALIPEDVWGASEARDMPSAYAIRELANQTGVHPAIVAGRVCHETGKYKKFGRLLGHGNVRKLFES